MPTLAARNGRDSDWYGPDIAMEAPARLTSPFSGVREQAYGVA